MSEEPCSHSCLPADVPCELCNKPKRVGGLLCQLAMGYTMHPVHDPDYVESCPNCQAGDVLNEIREDMAWELGFRLQRKKQPVGCAGLGDFLTWAIQDHHPLREMLVES